MAPATANGMHRWRTALVLAVLVMASCVGGCSRTGPPGGSNAPGWKISLEPSAPPVANKPAAFTARITDSAGVPITGANVVLRLNMTTMDMGEKRSQLTEKQIGRYSGIVIFTMNGSWQVVLEASRGKDRVVQAFDYNIR